MLKNYLTIFIRGFRKTPLFGVLNIAGLALGIASATLIFLYVEDEVSFDHQYSHRDDIYWIRMNLPYSDHIESNPGTPWRLADAARTEIPEVINITHLGFDRQLFASTANPNKNTYETGLDVDTGFFTIFQPIFLKGFLAGFKDEHTLILTATMAQKFFGSVDPIGKSLRVANEQDFTVIAVVKDPPTNTTLRYSYLSPAKNWSDRNRWIIPWSGYGITTVMRLRPGADTRNIAQQLTSILRPKDQLYAHANCTLWSIKDWRLRSRYTNGQPDGGLITFIDLISAIAWIIIIIACINFMNLATAKAGKRAREVGVRKTLGAMRKGLIRQFILESMLMSFLAVLLAVMLVYLTLPAFNTLAGKQLSFSPFTPVHFTGLAIIGVFCGLIAGSYPAFYLSSFHPVSVLKGQQLAPGVGTAFIRKTLVVLQFTMSVVLIVSTIIIYQQIGYVKSRDLGYDKEHLLTAPLKGDLADHFNTLKTDLLQTGAVANVSLSKSPALSMWVSENSQALTWPGADPGKKIKINSEWVTPEYFSTMGLQIVKGRAFYPDIKADSNDVIINETLANIIGKEAYIGNYLTYENTDRYRIVGIVKDFLFNDLYAPIAPLMTTCAKEKKGVYEFLEMRLRSGIDLHAALAKIETIVKTLNPGYPFDYSFVDDDFNDRFIIETRIGTLAATFSVLAIFISCLGLFGLAAYTAERRTREIGIRKVFGASTFSLTSLLSREFLQLVALSCAIAFPISWLCMHRLLSNFPYRTAIHWWVFAGAGIAALLIALLTVGFLTVKAALANPIRSLRTE